MFNNYIYSYIYHTIENIDILNEYNEILEEEKQFEMAITESLNSYTTQEKNPNIKLDMPSIISTIEHKDDNCTICNDEIELNRNIVKLDCSHIFHTECISEWVQYKAECPICRKIVKIIHQNNFSFYSYQEESDEESDEEDEEDEEESEEESEEEDEL